MKQIYRVYVDMTTELCVDLIASSKEEALLKAKDVDGSSFSETTESLLRGGWHIKEAELIEEID